MSGSVTTHETNNINEINNTDISLSFIFFTFFKIGSLAFGGYMALISVIENIIVKKHKLISHNDMLDGISLANLLPGPMAVNVVAFSGYKIRGKIGALAATTAVILPSFLLILGLSYFYFNFGKTAEFKNIFQGFMPAVAAIIISVSWRLGKKTLTGKSEFIIALTATLFFYFSPQQYKIYTPLFVIFISGLTGYILYNKNKTRPNLNSLKLSINNINTVGLISFFLILILFWFIPIPLEKNSILYLALTFASMSLMLFGGGYVFIPVIGSLVVIENGWLTSQEFTDGIALGQVTPGPILISATFIGYKVAGFWGALSSTVAIFGVPAILMIVVSRWFDFIRHSSATEAIMHGIHCAVIGMIFVAAIVILRFSFTSWPQIDFGTSWPILLIFIASLTGLIRFNLDVIWIIPTAGLLGYLFL